MLKIALESLGCSKNLVDYYDALYGHSVQKYKYNKVLNCDNMKTCVEELMNFHKATMEGAK